MRGKRTNACYRIESTKKCYLARSTAYNADEDVFLLWRRLVENGKAEYHPFPRPDLFMAATAILHDLCVVARNAVDFRRTGARVLNPWADFHPGLAD
jgi:predicted nucleic acid-binding protein